MEHQNKLVYKKPPLPNKKVKNQNSLPSEFKSSQQISLTKVGSSSKQKQISFRLPLINVPKYNSSTRIYTDTNLQTNFHSREKQTSIERKHKHLLKYQQKGSRNRISSVESYKRSIKSATSCRNSQQSTESIASQKKLFTPYISASSWIAYEMNQGKYLFGKRINKVRQMASLTKIMNLVTAISIIEELSINPRNLQIRVTKQSARINGTTAFLKQGMELSLYDLMFGMMLPSGNDAAYLIAQVLGSILIEKDCIKLQDIEDVDKLHDLIGKKEKPVRSFIQEMNRIAGSFNMANSKFTNTHGLSQVTNVSTALDLAKLCTQAIKNHLFFKIVNTKQYKFSYKMNKTSIQNINDVCDEVDHHLTWTNTNKMLWQGWNGVKTGVTPNAGPCLAASVEKTVNGKKVNILVILLGSCSMEMRWKQVKQIAQWVISQNLLS